MQSKTVEKITEILEQAVAEGHRIANDGNEERGIVDSLKNLADRAASIVSGITEQIKGKIADLFGGSEEAPGGELAEWIKDYSETVATTEVHAAVEESAAETWKEQGVTKLWWQCEISEDVCKTCLGNMESSPIKLGQAFSSGHATPPAHPRCRCSLEPY